MATSLMKRQNERVWEKNEKKRVTLVNLSIFPISWHEHAVDGAFFNELEEPSHSPSTFPTPCPGLPFSSNDESAVTVESPAACPWSSQDCFKAVLADISPGLNSLILRFWLVRWSSHCHSGDRHLCDTWLAGFGLAASCSFPGCRIWAEKGIHCNVMKNKLTQPGKKKPSVPIYYIIQ